VAPRRRADIDEMGKKAPEKNATGAALTRAFRSSTVFWSKEF